MKNNFNLKKSLSLIIISFFLLLILQLNPLFAATAGDQFKALGGKAGYGTSATDTDIGIIIGRIILVILSILGIVFLVLIIYGGFLWMTARGNEQQVEGAKKIITNATIGLAIIITSYAITWFVMNTLGAATGAIY